MSDELLPYYQKELAYIRKLGAEFAQSHGKIAERLRLGPDECLDPHVERMIEGFAYLTARIRHKLDDDFPELSDALLGVLYPHHLAPVPSMTVLQFKLPRAQMTLAEGYRIRHGATAETESGSHGACTFRTSYETKIWPIEVSSASIGGLGFLPAGAAVPERASGALRIELKCLSNEMTFAKLHEGTPEKPEPLKKFRFYLKGQPQHVYALYELIFNHALEVTISGGTKDSPPMLLGKSTLQQVGFDREEGLLPYSARSFLGYRLLSEYFAFPRKFLFVDVLLPPSALAKIGQKLDLIIYLNKTTPDLEQNVSADTIRLGCTPAVNLFSHRCEPIHLNQSASEYRIEPDARRPLSYEIWSIDRVIATSPNNEHVEFRPFYSFQHGRSREQQTTFYHAMRRSAGRYDGKVDAGTDMFISLVDLDHDRALADEWTLDVEATCGNRDLPQQLPFGGGQPRMQLNEGAAADVECVTQPTATFRPPLRAHGLWRLISQLSLNHLSLTGGDEGAEALREILRLHELSGHSDAHGKIDAITSVTSRRAVGRVGSAGKSGFIRGVEVNVEFNEERFSDNSMFLFACVIERFLALYCSINSFTQMQAISQKRKTPIRRWPPRAAEQVLL